MACGNIIQELLSPQKRGT